MRNYMKLLESKPETVVVEAPVVETTAAAPVSEIEEAYRSFVGEGFTAEVALDEGEGFKTAAAALAITGLMGGGASWATNAAAVAKEPVAQSVDLYGDPTSPQSGIALTSEPERPSAYMEPTQGPFAPASSRSAPPPQLVAKAEEGRRIDQMPMEFRQSWAYLALTIWGEARSEERAGMLAVGNVMMNRMREGRWGDTIQSVVTANRVSQSSGKTVYQFSCWGDDNRESMMRMYNLDRRLAGLLNSDPAEYQRLKTELESSEDWKAWLAAKDLAYKLLAGKASDNTGGANHYHTAAISPRWNERMSRTTRVGEHLFFTDRTSQS